MFFPEPKPDSTPIKLSIMRLSTFSLIMGVGIQKFFPCTEAKLMIVGGILGYCWLVKTYSKYDKVFTSCKLNTDSGAQPILKRKEKKEGYTLYEFTLPLGLSSEDFEKKNTAISQAVGRRVKIEYGYKNILLKEYDANSKTVYYYEPVKSNYDVPILIGYDIQGKPAIIDLSKGEPHMIIAGETGSGKSTVLRSIITNLITLTNVELALIDLKYGAEFGIFKNNAKYFAKTREEALELLAKIRADITTRYHMISKSGCNDIKSYNKRHNMPYKVLIIDEFAELMDEKQSIRLLEEIVSMARACGIHVILSTQRPDAKVLNGRIKANCATILGLKTTNDINSRIIIGEDGLEMLRGKGHGILKRAGEITEIQAPFLTIDEAQKLLNAAPKRCSSRPLEIVMEKRPLKDFDDNVFTCLDKLEVY